MKPYFRSLKALKDGANQQRYKHAWLAVKASVIDLAPDLVPRKFALAVRRQQDGRCL